MTKSNKETLREKVSKKWRFLNTFDIDLIWVRNGLIPIESTLKHKGS